MASKYIMVAGHGNRPLALVSYDYRLQSCGFFHTSCERKLALEKMVMGFAADVCHV